MGCCGGGHKHYQNMENQEKQRMNKNMEDGVNAKISNLMPILAFILVAGVAFYLLK